MSRALTPFGGASAMPINTKGAWFAGANHYIAYIGIAECAPKGLVIYSSFELLKCFCFCLFCLKAYVDNSIQSAYGQYLFAIL